MKVLRVIVNGAIDLHEVDLIRKTNDDNNFIAQSIDEVNEVREEIKNLF